MPMNPYFGMSNVFGGGSSFGMPGNEDEGTDYSGWNPSILRKKSFNQEPIISDGWNKDEYKSQFGGAFSNYDVKSPYEINNENDLEKFKPGPSLQRYLDFANQMPNREDYQPSGWGKALAAIAGGAAGYKDPASGIKTALAIREEPYRRASTDYEAKLKAMHDAAQSESQAENFEAMSGYRNYGAVTGRYRAAAQAATADERMQMNRNWNMARMGDMDFRQKMDREKVDENKRQFGITSTETERRDREMGGYAGRNTRVAETNRDIHNKDVDSQITTRENKPEPPKAYENRGPSPEEYNNADQQAATEVANSNPGSWGGFVDKFGHTMPPRGWMTGNPENSSEYQNFLVAQKRRRDEIIRQAHPGWVVYDPASPNNINSAPGVKPRQVPY